MEAKKIVLFDGLCNLCDRSVQFIIKRDKRKEFYFASLQGKSARELLAKYHLPADHLHSFVFIKDGKAYTRSSASLQVANTLGGAWKLLYVFMIVPKFIRDSIYNWIARNRYKWFGKKEECIIPTPALKSRFLD